MRPRSSSIKGEILVKKCLTILLTAILLATICIVPASAAKEMFTTLSSVSVESITLPIVGQKPTFSATVLSSANYTVSKVTWSEYNEDFEHIKDMTSTDTFREGYQYFIFITLESKGSCTFSSNLTQTIFSKTANKYPPTNDNKKVQIYTNFAAKKAINKVDLNVVKPVIGKTPTFAKVDTTEYCSVNSGASNMTNGVFWKNEKTNINLTISNPFKADGVYTVYYMLSSKDGYTFTNNTKFTINGQNAKVDALIVYYDSSNVGIYLDGLVPGDGKKEIGTLDLSVTAPKDGDKPDYTKIDGTGYYSDNGINGSSTKIYKNGIAWYKSASSYISPGTTETFKADNSYTVKISLSPKDGYKFTKSLTAKINGKTATVETFDDGSVTVSLTLTTLKKEHNHTNSDWKNDKENHWKVCTDKNCGTITVAKEVHKDANKDNKCDTCGYAVKMEETPTTSTPSTNDTPTTSTPSTDTTPSVSTPTTSESQTSTPEVEQPQDTEVEDTLQDVATDDNQDEESSAWIWIVAAAVVVLGGCATVAIVLIKKKK